MKKIIAAVMAIVMVMGLAACGSKPADKPAENPNSSESQQGIDVEKDLFDVQITLPADLVGEVTQADLDAGSDHYHSATLNEDGSVTIVMSKNQHKELMKEFAEQINTALTELPGSEGFPTITKVEANNDFTVFTVTTTSTELSISESFSVLAFYMYGGIYGTLNGADPNTLDVRVDFINADSGKLIDTARLSDSQEAMSN